MIEEVRLKDADSTHQFWKISPASIKADHPGLAAGGGVDRRLQGFQLCNGDELDMVSISTWQILW
jgi:hypothetical protein